MSPFQGLRELLLATLAVLPLFATVSADGRYYSQLQDCPQHCSVSGLDPTKWTAYYDVNELNYCKQPVSVEFTVFNSIEDPTTNNLIFACTGPPAGDAADDGVTNSTCGEAFEQEAKLQTILSADGNLNISAIQEAGRQAQAQFVSGSCNGTEIIGLANGAVVAVYSGGMIHNEGVAAFVDQFVKKSTPGITQVCDSGKDWTLGVMVAQERDTKAALIRAQKVLASWQSGRCATFEGGLESWSTTQVYQHHSSEPANGTIAANQTTRATLGVRAPCATYDVQPGNDCYSIATQKCQPSIDLKPFYSYNPGIDCNNLRKGQSVCCSAGEPPDKRKKPNADGSCYAYDVIAGDNCADLSVANGLDTQNKEIENFNKNTWGWSGCKSLQFGQRMCLSEGDPPMPAELANAICGPQVPGTKRPEKGEDLIDLNPCPLNACCNVWGQCGTDPNFCKEYESPTGAPGSAPPGSNGCISSCGTEITNIIPPKEEIKIGYFEAWNHERECLHMDVRQMKSSGVTHIHFAFANIVPDTFDVDISAVQEQFDLFKSIKNGPKKILSFGGWKFSTDGATYAIFRKGVTDAQRELFAQKVADFLVEHELDGVDFDWEYPAAPDNQGTGIPIGDSEDGTRYLEFLKMVYNKIDKKSLSIAAPASYWYLKGFPIKLMYSWLDYIVYMTYDLHGQWDLNNKWATLDCPETGCLRSHVNLTETKWALAMITKAGVPTGKLVVGVSSYGRAFHMSNPSCTGPQCTFTANGAEKGKCTAESGYIANAEINELARNSARKRDGVVKVWYDEESDSDMMTWGENWVAWMSDATKARRATLYRELGFAGDVNWADDLTSYRAKYTESPIPGEESPGIDPHSVSCDDPGILDSIKGEWNDKTWKAMGADIRWAEIVEECDGITGVDWTECVGDQIKAAVDFQCFDLNDDNNCRQQPSIAQCELYDSVADWAIHVSMISAFQYYYNLYDTFTGTTQQAMYSDIGKFADHFGLQMPPANKARDIGVTIGNMIFGFAASFIGGGMGKYASSFFQRGVTDAVKWGTINGVITTMNKVVNTPAEAMVANARFAEERLGLLANTTTTIIDGVVEHYFGGENDAPLHLGAIISGGMFVGDNRVDFVDAGDSYKFWTDWIYGPLMPELWNIGYDKRKGGGAVYVLDTGEKCSTHLSDYDQEKDDAVYKNFLDEADWENQCACDKEQNRMYCLFIAGRDRNGKGNPLMWKPTGITSMCNIKWRNGALPQGDECDVPPREGETANWSGVSTWRIINAALATYKANGFENCVPESRPKADTFESVENMQFYGIENPGTIFIPVCASYYLAKSNLRDWTQNHDHPAYPCAPDPDSQFQYCGKDPWEQR